jgi:hypothetical protein
MTNTVGRAVVRFEPSGRSSHPFGPFDRPIGPPPVYISRTRQLGPSSSN